MNDQLCAAIDDLIREAPRSWLESVSNELRSWPGGAEGKGLIHRLPQTYNGDVAFKVREIISMAEGALSWEALACTISVASTLRRKWEAGAKVDLLWAGPAPPNEIPARRIDQVLYDLIAEARKDVLLVTFAAHKVPRLARELVSALRRGVRVRLLLEFGSQSQQQLTHDALNAFPEELRAKAEIYFWPLEKREQNVLGKPGKLHAKVAVVDDQALLSSANLTDDAFLRNLELGVIFNGGQITKLLRNHIEHLTAAGIITRWRW